MGIDLSYNDFCLWDNPYFPAGKTPSHAICVVHGIAKGDLWIPEHGPLPPTCFVLTQLWNYGWFGSRDGVDCWFYLWQAGDVAKTALRIESPPNEDYFWGYTDDLSFGWNNRYDSQEDYIWWNGVASVAFVPLTTGACSIGSIAEKLNLAPTAETKGEILPVCNYFSVYRFANVKESMNIKVLVDTRL